MRAPDGSTLQVDDVTVTIEGPARLLDEPSTKWAIGRLGLPWLDASTTLATFELAASDHHASITVILRAPGDSRRLVALVRTSLRSFAVSFADDQDAALCVFPADGVSTAVQVLLLRDADAVMTCVDWFGGAPGFGAGPEPESGAEPEPEWMPDLEPAAEAPEFEFEFEAESHVGSEDDGIPSGSRTPRPPMVGVAPPEPPPPPPTSPPVDDAEAESPSAGAEPVEAHVAAEMPRTAKVGDIVDLDFRLSRFELTPTPGLVSDARITAATPDLPFDVSITLRGYRLASGASRRSVRLPRTGAARRRFRLEATDEGPAEVSVIVRQGGENPLVTLRLVSRIGDAQTSERATADLDAGAPDAALDGLPILRVDESLSRGTATLDVAVRIGDDSVHAVKRGIDKAAVISTAYARIDALRVRLEKDEHAPVESRIDVALGELRAIGVELARQLLPLRVRRFLHRHRDRLDDLIVQTTGEFDVPWELVYVSDPDHAASTQPLTIDGFLGMRGATRWVHNTALPTEVQIAKGRATYLCPNYRDGGLSLSFSRSEGPLVRRAYQATTLRPGDAAAMSSVVEKGFDLLHFGGHGVWLLDPPDQRLLFANYRRTGTPPKGSSWSASDLRSILPDLEMVSESTDRRMVFLNACDVGRMDTATPGLGGFPEAFLRGGVGVLVGCSWAIDDEAAGQFVRDFYEALTHTHLAGAMRLARRTALANADITALAYVAYAHPRARIVPA